MPHCDSSSDVPSLLAEPAAVVHIPLSFWCCSTNPGFGLPIIAFERTPSDDLVRLNEKHGTENVAMLMQMFRGDQRKVRNFLHGCSEISTFTMTYKPHTNFVLEEKKDGVA